MGARAFVVIAMVVPSLPTFAIAQAGTVRSLSLELRSSDSDVRMDALEELLRAATGVAVTGKAQASSDALRPAVGAIVEMFGRIGVENDEFRIACVILDHAGATAQLALPFLIRTMGESLERDDELIECVAAIIQAGPEMLRPGMTAMAGEASRLWTGHANVANLRAQMSAMRLAFVRPMETFESNSYSWLRGALVDSDPFVRAEAAALVGLRESAGRAMMPDLQLALIHERHGWARGELERVISEFKR